MAITAGTIIARASTTLLDPQRVAWTTAELLDYLNAAQRAVCLIRPDAYVKIQTAALVPGVVQSLPADGQAVLRVLYNANGASVAQAGIDAMLRVQNWAMQTPSVTVREWASDSRMPKTFFVSPPAAAGASVVMMYAAIPPAITGEASLISLSDAYETPLWAYVCGLAYAKNSRRQDVAKSQSMMQMFTALLTGGALTQQAIAPDLKKVEQAQS